MGDAILRRRPCCKMAMEVLERFTCNLNRSERFRKTHYVFVSVKAEVQLLGEWLTKIDVPAHAHSAAELNEVAH